MPGKYKIDELDYTCRVCGREYVLNYKSRNKRLNRAKKEGREIDFSLCTTCAKKINKNTTMMKRHNTIHALRVPEFMEKRNQTMIERVGTKDAMKVPEFKAKHRQTCLKNYGNEIASRTDKVKAKQRKTNLERYDVVSTALVPEIKQKQIDTMIKNHGTADLNRIRHPEGSKLEQAFQREITNYFFEHNLPYKLIPDFRIYNKNFDFAILNPDGSINSFVECDGSYYHGNKYKEGYYYSGNKISAESSIKNDRLRLFKSDYLQCKIFIIREEGYNEINEEDFNKLISYLNFNYKEWLNSEILKIGVFYSNVINNMQIYNNFINSMRIKYYGFTPYDIENKLIKQEDGYLYKDHEGSTPYDIKPGDEYLL